MAPTKEKKEKKAKDPNAPTKPQSAYMLWSVEGRKQLKEDEPDLKFGEVGKRLGEIWNTLPNGDKEKWQAAAERAKKKYEQLLAEYVKTPGYHQFQQAKGKPAAAKKAPKDKSGPKKAITSFMAYSKENRSAVIEANPGIKFGEIGTLLGQQWKALSADKKKKYEQIAEADKARYAKELEKHKAGGSSSKAAAAADEEDDEEEEQDDEDGDEDDE